jgi:hypothetical protein
MRVSINFALPLAALLFVFLLVPQAAMAGSENCPKEPATDVPIATGDTFIGSNCTLYTVGDVDSFVFSGNKGDIWAAALALNGTVAEDICLTLYPPTGAAIYSGCTTLVNAYDSVWTFKPLPTTGTYTMAVIEASTDTRMQNYAVSLERLYPTPPNAQPATLGKVYAGDLAWVADSNAFTFEGVANDQFEVSAALPSGAPQDLCMFVFSTSGSLTADGCTSVANGGYTVSIDITPPKSGTNLVLLAGTYNDTVQGLYDAIVPSYSLEVSCLVGPDGCVGKPIEPGCTLKDSATYDPTSSTLTMNFTVGNEAATTWNAWLTSGNNVTRLFSISRPITNPPVTIIKTASLSPGEEVGVLSTLTTSANGIICSNLELVSTVKQP